MPPEFQNQEQSLENKPSTPIPPKHHRSAFYFTLAIALAVITLGGLFFYIKEISKNTTEPLAIETPVDEFADWKTYRNEEYGFEFKYPKEIIIEEGEDKKSVRLENYIADDKEGLSPNEFFMSIGLDTLTYFNSLQLGNTKEGVLNGYKIYEGDDFSAKLSPMGPHVIFIEKNNSGVSFIIQKSNERVDEEVEKVIDQILSTFKFIDSTPTTGTEQFCGGIAAIQCPTGYECRLDGNYPDAGGKCQTSPVKEN